MPRRTGGQHRIFQDAHKKRHAGPPNFLPFSRSLSWDENNMNRKIRNSKNSTGKSLSTDLTSQVRIAVIAAIYLAYGTVDPHRVPHRSS
jgi:hypothetical protein